jgi:hypothetical protein
MPFGWCDKADPVGALRFVVPLSESLYLGSGGSKIREAALGEVWAVLAGAEQGF